MAKNYVFRDLNLNFLENPFNGDISTLKDEAAITQSIKNIILTDRFEVPFDSGFGGNITSLLFEPVSKIVESILKDRIETAIRNYEPRVEIDEITVQARPDSQSYSVTIKYTAVITDTALEVSFFLERIL